jgi:hypothetical protein
VNHSNEFQLGSAKFIRNLDNIRMVGLKNFELSLVTLAQVLQNRLVLQTRRAL